MEVKVIANYLPQFHQTPENDAWWGEGYTDWVAVRAAKPVIDTITQPKIPLDGNYYSLDKTSTIRWQAELAKKYCVNAFGIYHYWFNKSQNLLTKPVELLINNRDIDQRFMFLWDNSSWKRTWSNVRGGNDWAPKFDDGSDDETDGILARLIYGSEDDWKAHFYYLLPFFKDDRYIKINGNPLFGFFKPDDNISVIRKMVRYWDILAKKEGFSGICCISKTNWKHINLNNRFEYNPFSPFSLHQKIVDTFDVNRSNKSGQPRCIDYDSFWLHYLKHAKRTNSKTFLSGVVSFDDTPRRGNKARILLGASPEKFERYFTELLKISKAQNKEYVFLTAWNEWGEGAYLEPDEEHKYAYLEAVKRAMEIVNGH